jgi:exosome complex component MTR3
MNKVTIGNVFKYPEEVFGDPLSYLDENGREKLLEELENMNKSKKIKEEEKEKMFMRTGCVNEAKGSCYIEIGNTKVICSLYGPREIPKKDEFSYKTANLNCQFRYATFSSCFNDKANNTSASTGTSNLITMSTINSNCLFQQQLTQQQKSQFYLNQNLSSMIEEALKPSVLLHKYPKSQIDLFIVCIENDYKKKFSNNTVLSASIIAASMSLIDASIECYDLVSSHTNILNNLTLSYMPSLHQITSVYFIGDSKLNAISVDLYKSYVKDSVENCKKISSIMKFVLLEKYKKLSKNMSSSDEDEYSGDDNDDKKRF